MIKRNTHIPINPSKLIPIFVFFIDIVKRKKLIFVQEKNKSGFAKKQN